MKIIGLCLALATGVAALAADATAPNIVFILTDDQSWTDLATPMDPAVPAGGSEYFRTPNMTRLATEGMRFPSGYASATICTPTRRSIQYGMTPARQRGTEFLSPFDPQGKLSLPQALKRANAAYRCAHFGKWGEVMSGGWKPHPERAGFDESDPGMAANPAALGYDESDGVTGNFDGGFYLWRYVGQDSRRNHDADVDPDPKRTFSVTGRATAFMEREAKARRPFYLQVSYYAIHTAYQARPATIAKYANAGLPPRQLLPGLAPMLEDLDAGVGQLLDAIDRLGLRDNTYVFFSADNGGELAPRITAPEILALPPRNHPLRNAKQSLYEGGIRVPFIVRGPGIAGGSVCRVPVVGYDLLPTFAALAGDRTPLPAEIDGGSLVQLFKDPVNGAVKRNAPGLVFHRPLHRTQPHSALRVGDFKLVLTWAGPWQIAQRELFNLTEDIGEQNNLAERMRPKADEMTATLIAYLRSVDAQVAPEITKQP
jgi:arylsulfatase A